MLMSQADDHSSAPPVILWNILSINLFYLHRLGGGSFNAGIFGGVINVISLWFNCGWRGMLVIESSYHPECAWEELIPKTIGNLQVREMFL